MTTVEQLLAKATEKYPSIEVEKPLGLSVDVGNLSGFDSNPFEMKEYRSNPQGYLNTVARDDVQWLVNEIWKLPTHNDEDGMVYAKLPEGTTVIPRFQKVPKPKPMTKWERYAKEKGITKRKKTKLVWDEELKKWVPRFGYRKVAADKEKNWLVELPDKADPMEDQFAKAKEAKKERIAKNELQRLKNIARARKIQIPSVGLPPLADPALNKEKMDLTKLKKAIPLVRKATASVGHFTKDLPKEKGRKAAPGKKRKFDPLLVDSETEKHRSLEILKKIGQKAPKLDVEQAVSQEAREERIQDASERREGGKKRSQKKARGKKAVAAAASILGGKIRKNRGKKGKGKPKGKGKR